MSTQAIQKREAPNSALVFKVLEKGLITNLKDLQDRMNELAEVANVLFPAIASPVLPAKQAVALAAVQIDPDRDCYTDVRFTKKDEVAPGKTALLALMQAAAINHDATTRIDDMRDPNYANVQVTISGRDLAGTWRTVTDSKEMDLRPGAAETMQPETVTKNGQEIKTGKMVPKKDTAIADLRRHVQSHGETKALERALREFLRLRHVYKRAEVERLWIVPRLVLNLDMGDPEDREFARREAAGHNRNLYGKAPLPELPQRTAAPPPRKGEPIEAEVIDRTSSPTDGGDGQEARTPWQSAPEQPAGSSPAPSTSSSGVDDLEVPAGLAGPELIVCLCPCDGGCQKETTQAVAEKTTQQLGTPRCAECFPGKTFNFDKHKDVHDFKIPNFPNLTFEQIRKSVQASAAKNGSKK